MSEEDDRRNKEDEYMRGGKGRTDEVGRSGIYPASVPNAPVDAEIRTEENLVAHKGPLPGRKPPPKSTEEEG